MADLTVQSKFSTLGGREIQLGVTRKPITAWGGLALFAAFCETVGFRAALDGALACLGRVSPNALPASDHFLAFMVGVLTGAARFLHLALLPAREAGYTLDLDSTVLERFGEQEGVLPGYNPRRHGRPTHHPLLAGLAEAKWILHGWLRAGNAASANNVRAFMDECFAQLDGIAKLRLMRADSGFFDGKFLDFLEGKALPYLVKGRMTKLVKLAVLGVSEWTRVGRGIEVAEARIRLLGWSRERRLVVIRQEVATKETKALGKRLFECKGYTFQAIVTSLEVAEMDAVTAYRTYNGRADFENRIKELKRGCGLEGFCMDSFTATECVLRTLCLVHNLVQHFQDRVGLRPADAPKKDGKRHVLETLRHTLFTCAAVLGQSGRAKVLRLSATDAWLVTFHAALSRILAPIANCKAPPIEGPFMALMA